MTLRYLFGVAAIVFLGGDCLGWFLSGTWSPMTLSAFWHFAGGIHPYLQSPSAQQIVETILGIPIFAILGFAGLAIGKKG